MATFSLQPRRSDEPVTCFHCGALIKGASWGKGNEIHYCDANCAEEAEDSWYDEPHGANYEAASR